MKNFIRVTTTVAILAVSAAGSAQAYDGKITFTGSVTAATCTIDGNGQGSPDFTLNLGSVQTTALTTNNKRGASHGFYIDVGGNEDCTETAGRVRFEAMSPQIDAETGYLKNTTGSGRATNVSVVLMDKDKTDILLNKPEGGLSPVEDLSDSSATRFNFYAAMVGPASGTVTAGTVDTHVLYSMSYN